MTVKELIEELQKQPQDATVCVGRSDGAAHVVAGSLYTIWPGRRNKMNHRFTVDESAPWGDWERVVLLKE